MGRSQKEYISLNMRVDAEIMHRFNDYCERMGQTKTLAFERIVTAHIDRVEQEERERRELLEKKGKK